MRIKAIIVCLLLSLPVSAQQQQPSRSELESRKKQIMDAIHETEQQLEATKKDKNATLGQLRALQNKLAERQRLISNINDEIDNISSSISTSASEVNKLKHTLEALKTRYAQSVRYSYENRSSYDMLAFIFSSGNFNEAMRRMRYLKKMRDYRKQEVEQIRITQHTIEHKIGVLNAEKAQKDELLTEQVEQKKVLQQETNQTNQVVNDLKGREKELKEAIEKNRKVIARVDKAINDVIRREIELARKKAEEEARKKAEEEAKKASAEAHPRTSGVKVTTTTLPPSNTRPATTTTSSTPAATRPTPVYNLNLTPEAAALSDNFENNKGRLPWPVEKGFISELFGRHPHPIAEKVMIENNGIGIRTAPNAIARSVFDGTLSSAFFIPGNGWTAIVTHGRYFTVYSGLASVSVKKDQPVHTKQQIGVVGTTDEGEPTINFQIWKSNGKGAPIKLDPSSWIAR